jgi:hypothetical protein
MRRGGGLYGAQSDISRSKAILKLGDQGVEDSQNEPSDDTEDRLAFWGRLDRASGITVPCREEVEIGNPSSEEKIHE